MTRERWLVDGYNLAQGLVRDVSSHEGLYAASAVTATDIDIPMRDGTFPSPGRLGPGSFSLSFWLAGASPTALLMHWEEILRKLVKRHRLVHFVQQRPDGTHRECLGRVSGRVQPTPIGRLGMKAQVEVEVPSGKWLSTQDSDTGHMPIVRGGSKRAPVQWFDPRPGEVLHEDEVPEFGPYKSKMLDFRSDGSAIYEDSWEFLRLDHYFVQRELTAGPVDRLIELPGFAGSSAPMTNLRFDFTGPLTGLKVTCPETGTWLAYDRPLTGNESLYVNARDDFVTAPLVDAFRYSGPYMMEVIPADLIDEKPVLRIQATEAGLGARLRIRGRRAYLI